MTRFLDRHLWADALARIAMPFVLYAALTLVLAGCDNVDSENARSHRLAALSHEFGCRDTLRNTDQGAIIEPKHVDDASKLGHVDIATATSITTSLSFDVILWCAK